MYRQRKKTLKAIVKHEEQNFNSENSGDKNINREIHSLRKKCESVVADESICHSKSNRTSEVRRCEFSKLHFPKCQLGRSGSNVPVSLI